MDPNNNNPFNPNPPSNAPLNPWSTPTSANDNNPAPTFISPTGTPVSPAPILAQSGPFEPSPPPSASEPLSFGGVGPISAANSPFDNHPTSSFGGSPTFTSPALSTDPQPTFTAPQSPFPETNSGGTLDLNSLNNATDSVPPAGGEGGVPSFASPNSNAPVPTEAAPTDLSQLVSTGSTATAPTETAGAAPVETPTNSQETVLTTPAAETTQVVQNSHGRGFPKWIILAAVLLLLGVGGGSAYFILGVGKGGEATTSVPAETEAGSQGQLTNPPKVANPSPSPTTQTQGAGFGSLPGASPSAQVASPSAQPTGVQSGNKSAIELLKSRQGQ